ncbi:MAG: hypothetical protein LBJ57_07650 [Prevotellaceae bacterium]|jgi:hypothetical protein|nr:hypothetical protein [Prevotellaceae bacterium]
MSSFFKSLTEVNVASKFYKGLAITSVCASTLASLAVFVSSGRAVERERSKVYALATDGSVLPMVQQRSRETRPVEATAHVRMLLMYLFEIDRLTYKDRLARAYDLGNSSIYALYKEQEEGDWYVDVEQYNARSTLIINSMECDDGGGRYLVNAAFTVIINSDITKNKRYDLEFEVVVVDGAVARTERNPHNMLVVQIRKKKFVEVAPK